MEIKYFIPIKLKTDINIVKETLNRIGIPNKTDNILYQTCHLICEKNSYIIHFKEYFGYNNNYDISMINMEENDFYRRNTIIFLLYKWNLIDFESHEIKKYIEEYKSSERIFIIPYKEKNNWNIKKKINLL